MSHPQNRQDVVSHSKHLDNSDSRYPVTEPCDIQGDMLVAEMLTKIFKRKAAIEGIPGDTDLLAAFLHQVSVDLLFLQSRVPEY